MLTPLPLRFRAHLSSYSSLQLCIHMYTCIFLHHTNCCPLHCLLCRMHMGRPSPYLCSALVGACIPVARHRWADIRLLMSPHACSNTVWWSRSHHMSIHAIPTVSEHVPTASGEGAHSLLTWYNIQYSICMQTLSSAFLMCQRRELTCGTHSLLTPVRSQLLHTAYLELHYILLASCTRSLYYV